MDKYKGKKIIFNDDDLTIDLTEREKEKIDLNEFNRILNEYWIKFKFKKLKKIDNLKKKNKKIKNLIIKDFESLL